MEPGLKLADPLLKTKREKNWVDVQVAPDHRLFDMPELEKEGLLWELLKGLHNLSTPKSQSWEFS